MVIKTLSKKYIATSARVGYATHSLYASSGPGAEGVLTNNLRRLGSGPWLFWGGLDKSRHIVPMALLVRIPFISLVHKCRFCGDSVAKRHIGITLSVVRPSVPPCSCWCHILAFRGTLFFLLAPKVDGCRYSPVPSVWWEECVPDAPLLFGYMQHSLHMFPNPNASGASMFLLHHDFTANLALYI